MAFWVYILRCADDSYYTGHTDNLDVRLAQHHAGAIASCYTLKRRPLQLVHVQDFPRREDALAAELQIKRWSRAKKEALIAADWDGLMALSRDHAGLRKGGTDMGDLEGGREDRGSTGSPRTDPESPPHVLGAGERGGPAASSTVDAQHEHWMRHAFALADRAEREFDEIPVGAVLLGADGEVLGEGWNRNLADHDPTAHAEIIAMRQAGQRLGNHRLVGTTLYVTLEPCAMCAMAIVHARVARVVFGATDPKTGACGSVFDLIADARHNHRVEVLGGVLGEEAGRRLTNYFRAKRGRPLI